MFVGFVWARVVSEEELLHRIEFKFASGKPSSSTGKPPDSKVDEGHRRRSGLGRGLG